MTNSADSDQLASSACHVVFSKRRVKSCFFGFFFLLKIINRLSNSVDPDEMAC